MQNTIFCLAARLGEILQTRDWRVSCAESCTGGGIAYGITSTSGSSAWFEKGFVTYSNEAKQELLGVQAQTLVQFGAVSEQTVLEMARGCANNSGAQVAIAVSGIAGPTGGSPEKPVGTVWFGFYLDGKALAEMQVFDGDRHQVREQSVQFALQRILQLLGD